jgi:hypothetical protein
MPATSEDAFHVTSAKERERRRCGASWLVVGHFVAPADGPRLSLDVEVKWSHHPAGDASTRVVVGDWRASLTLLVQGRFAVWVDGEQTLLEQPGDYVIWSPAPDRWHSWRALADSVMVTVRWPSGRVPGQGW